MSHAVWALRCGRWRGGIDAVMAVTPRRRLRSRIHKSSTRTPTLDARRSTLDARSPTPITKNE